jgi:hypothetical protein
MFSGAPSSVPVNDIYHQPTGYVFDVYSVDEYGNITNSSTDNIQITTSDPYAIPVTITALNSDGDSDGLASMKVIFHTAMSGVSVTAIDTSNAGIIGFTTPAFITTPGNPYGLQIIVPGAYVAAGSGGLNSSGTLWNNGVAGSPNDEVAGVPFPVSILACDEFGNFTSTSGNDYIVVSSTDKSQLAIPSDYPSNPVPVGVTLSSGIVEFTGELVSVGGQVLSLVDDSNNNMSAHTPAITADITCISPNSLDYLIIVNGVSNTNTSGAYVNVTAFPATFNVTVELVDPNTDTPIYGVANSFSLTPVLYGNETTLGDGKLTTKAGSFTGGSDVWTTTVETYNVAEAIQIRVADTSDTWTAQAIYSCEIIVGADPATATFTLTANPPNIQANTNSVISAHLVDGNGNPIANQLVNFYISQGTGALSTTTASTINPQNGTYQDASVDFTGAFVNGRTSIVGWFNTTAGPKWETATVSVSLVNPQDGILWNYPNPFRAGAEPTNISWLMTTPNPVTLDIYNLFGELVYKTSFTQQQIASLIQSEGNVVTIQWNGKNNKGQVVGNGGYIAIVSTTIDGLPKKMVRKIAVAK